MLNFREKQQPNLTRSQQPNLTKFPRKTYFDDSQSQSRVVSDAGFGKAPIWIHSFSIVECDSNIHFGIRATNVSE